MDSYMIELFGGGVIEITGEEYRNILGKNGLVFLKNSKQTINTSAIKRIVPAKTYGIDKMMYNQEHQKEGVLHDGTQVFKHFGIWYLLNGDYDNNGNPLSRPAPEWYPEVARDCVPTKMEYETKYKHLPISEAKKLVVKNFDRAIGRGETDLKELLTEQEQKEFKELMGIEKET